MLTMFRLDEPEAEKNTPFRFRSSRRVPGNVPFVIDNLWEWSRPEGMPSRRQSVFATPKPELALRFGRATDGSVFRVTPVGAKIVQIPQQDARFHPDVQAPISLEKMILSILGQAWVDGSMQAKQPEGLLWMPCLTKEEVESVFNVSARLASKKAEILAVVRLWQDAVLVDADQEDAWPYEDGEIFFEAATWSLFSR